MGYFRLFYYIAYVLNFVLRMLKRHGKFLLLLACIFVFLVICLYQPESHALYQGNYGYGDPNYGVITSFENTCLDFLYNYSQLDREVYGTLMDQFESNFKSNNFNTYVFYSANNNQTEWTGINMINGQTYNTTNIFILLYPNRVAYFNRTASQYNNYLGITCDVNEVTFNVGSSPNSIPHLYMISNNELSEKTLNYSTYKIILPSMLFNYVSSNFYHYFIEGMSFSDVQLLNDIDSKLDLISNTVDETQEYLTEEPSSEDFSTSDLPSDSGVTDTTETGLTNIFSQIYNAFTGTPNNQNNIVVPVPFTGKSFTINYNLTSNIVNGFSNQWVKNIISVFWYYIISRYIILDLVDKFEKIQTGNIENLENENIKGDML